MKTKRCSKCRVDKPLECFGRYSSSKDGHQYNCRPCHNEENKRWHFNNREKLKKYYQMNRENIILSVAKWDRNNKEKKQAHRKVRDAIETGRLVRLPCSVCGADRAHGHHEDYSKPLEVIWLCATHHKEIHRKLKANKKEV